MCGRFTLAANEQLLKDEFGFEEFFEFTYCQYNIAPQTYIPVIRLKENALNLSLMLWGLTPSWAKDSHIKATINARCETLLEKPMFRKPYQKQRCLIPASGFYEWDAHKVPKQPYYFSIKDKPIFAFAGIWDRWMSSNGEVIESCALITKEAEGSIREIHDRMPVILKPQDYCPWLTCKNSNFFKNTLNEFIYYPVSKLVNSPKVDSANLIEPISLH